MALLKPQALPIVVEDISNSLHRASRNAIWAIGMIQCYVRNDSATIEFDSLARVLGRAVFEYGEASFPTKLDNLKPFVGEIQQVGEIYWPVYSYLFGLLPWLVKIPRVGGRRWSRDEYRRLEVGCFERWFNVNKTQDPMLFLECNKCVSTAGKSWFLRRKKLGEALDSCVATTATRIEALVPQFDGRLAANAFRYGLEGFLYGLSDGFERDLGNYWIGAGAFSFFASDPTLLAPHITGNYEEFERELRKEQARDTR